MTRYTLALLDLLLAPAAPPTLVDVAGTGVA
jgi:hypothetical protein